ncbi:MAG TPA: MarR family transcriptional regulator [Bryobacteraceae bacterium]|jgi:DNA-binding MarR family transcriptional regulator
MVVQSSGKKPASVLDQLDLGYLALFLGFRVNELVIEHAAAAGFADVRESHGFLIQHLIESERTITELAERMEVTQQAASKAVAELAALGAVEVVQAEDRRAKRVRLSARGWQIVHFGRKTRRRIDRRLRVTAGAGHYETARSILQTCLKALGGIERIESRRIRQPR